jgi:PAS domain S-box-containing protein
MQTKDRQSENIEEGFGRSEYITEVTRQEALLKSGALQYAIFHSENFSCIATDAMGTIQIFNLGAERMLGYSAAEVLNKITPADISDSMEVIARAKALSLELHTPIAPGFEALVFKASRGIEDIYELTYIRKDGSRFPAVVSVTALRGVDKGIIGYLLIGTDNTARKSAEEALIKAGALQRAIFSSSSFSAIATDARGVIQIFNVGAERMLGYTADEVINKITPAVISDPAELVTRAAAMSAEFGIMIAPGFEALVFKASRGIEDIYELTKIRKDGSRFAGMVSVTALRDAQDAIIGYLLIGTDNTMRKKAEEALRENNALLRTIHLHSIVSVADLSGNIVDVNDSFCKISGFSREELLGQNHRIINSGAHDGKFWRGMWRSISSGQTWRGEICNRAKDGSLYWVDSIIMPFIGEDGHMRKYISIRTDITASKEYEGTLRKATQKAEQANLAQSEFLANMSHEIRTPMNAVIGMSYLLGKTSMDEQQFDLLSKIKFASKSLLVVLNNVLDLSKIEAGEMIVERAVFSLQSLLSELAEVIEAQAEVQRITFEMDALDLPDALVGDSALLGQILANLLSNAIKFTESGGVKLSVRTLSSSSKAVKLCFTVQDTGIGISREVQARLFAPFAQADASITRRFGGTGLGLSIVKRLTTLMGGQVLLQSVMDVGSEFKVILEFDLAASANLPFDEATPASPENQALFGTRVLLVDDSDINLEVTRRILELEGARVWLAHNGQEAVDFLKSKCQDVDVVLMDVQMPVLNGYDATKLVRVELGMTNLPIIALTAGALSSERGRAAAVGMTDFLVKPYDTQTLLRNVLRHVKKASPRDPGQVPNVPETNDTALPPWPEIEGIDSREVRERLRDDRGLFESMVNRLVGEYSNVAIGLREVDAFALAVHGTRMHKLRGIAGMLGAREMMRLAGEVEARCMAGEAEEAADLTAQLAAQIQRLSQSAKVSLGATLRPQPEAATAAKNGSTGAATVSAVRIDPLVPWEMEKQRLAVKDPKGNPDAETKEAVRPVRILVAEDCPEIQLLIQMYLEGSSYELTCEADGQAAVDRFAKADFDLVLMDLQMPVLDGFSATRAIRGIEQKRAASPVPIIALTSYSSQYDIERSSNAGCNAHLCKPISESELLEAIEKYQL